MKTLVVAYRSNNLFAQRIPDILSLLPASVTVHQIAYPAGSLVEELRADLQSRLEAMDEPFYYLSDTTCSIRTLDSTVLERRKQFRSGDIEVLPVLDDAFRDAAAKVLEAGSFETGLLKLAMFASTNPTAICIVTASVFDHVLGFEDEEMLCERFGAGDGLEFADKPGFAAFIGEVMGKVYPGVPTTIVQDFGAALADPEVMRENVLLVVDRHALSGHLPEEAKSFVWDITAYPYGNDLFMLPFENAIAHLLALGRLKSEWFANEAIFETLFAKVDFSS